MRSSLEWPSTYSKIYSDAMRISFMRCLVLPAKSTSWSYLHDTVLSTTSLLVSCMLVLRLERLAKEIAWNKPVCAWRVDWNPIWLENLQAENVGCHGNSSKALTSSLAHKYENFHSFMWKNKHTKKKKKQVLEPLKTT